MCTIDINLRVVSVKVSCGSGRIAAGGTFSDDVLGHFCFTRQNTLQGSCLWDVYEASCTKLLIQSHTVVMFMLVLFNLYVALQNVRHRTN